MNLVRGIINQMNEIESKSNNPQICITTRENIPQKITKMARTDCKRAENAQKWPKIGRQESRHDHE